MSDDNVNLGLATTAELLTEIRVRGEAERHYRQIGSDMAMGAANLMEQLPGSMLRYRTVDEERARARGWCPLCGFTGPVSQHDDEACRTKMAACRPRGILGALAAGEEPL